MTLNRSIALGLTAIAAGLATPIVHAGESYVGIGIPGLMVGYAHTINTAWGLRADYAGLGSINKTRTESGITYQGTLKAQRLGLFADYFPMAGSFRLTGGLTFNDMGIKLKSQFDGATPVTVGNQTFTPSANDYFNADVKFPRTTPYLGIGWGHQDSTRGLGFVADVGVMIGKAKVTSNTNVVGRYGITQADVDTETDKLRDGVGKVSFIPQLSVGLSYHY
jgi:hypothetical protein